MCATIDQNAIIGFNSAVSEGITPAGVLRVGAVLALVGLSRASVYRLMDANQFPRPVQLSKGAVAWRASDVATWLRNRTSTKAPAAA